MINRQFSILILLFSLSIPAIAQQKTIDQRVVSLLKLMTLQEKIGQLNQYSGRQLTGPESKVKTNLQSDIRSGWVGSMLNVKGVKDTREIQALAMESRLKIPLLFSLDVIHGYKTTFPIPLAEAASWDLEAIKRSAHIAAKESAASGIHWTFAPMVDISRDPRWGRVMEGAGEDTYLGSLIAIARVQGLQGDQLGSTDAIMACAKHFAAYGASIGGRDYNAVDLSDHQLWETYLPPFKAAADAGVATFMNSFNTLNGIPATGNKYLQRDILKEKWDFKGFVVSDWGSIGEMVPWGYAKDDAEAAEKAMNAGSDMDMESRAYKSYLQRLVRLGKVEEDLIDDAVKRILYKKFELGLFDDPYKFSDFKREAKVLNDASHKVAARDIAKKSIVLLKNEGRVLPLSKGKAKLALIGPLVKSKRDMNGSWIVNSDTTQIVNLYDGIKAKLGKKNEILYAYGCDVNSESQRGFEEAISIARQSDVVVMALGETWDMSGEAKSKTNIHITGQQEALFNAVKAQGKPVVVVLMAGRPIIFNDIVAKADAIIYAWWLGDEAGNAIADVLYGDYNPSGKLPLTFPRSEGQIPLSYNYYNTGRPIKNPNNIVYKSAYIDSPNTPLYAFGYGLSYTTFNYSDLVFSKDSVNLNDSIKVSFKLSNTGKVTGEEVVQLYLKDEVASVVRPSKELKDFKKVFLKAGESKTVTFTINREKLSFYNSGLDWVAEPGVFELMIGTSSDTILLQKKFVLN